jgi:hypothetical protein
MEDKKEEKGRAGVAVLLWLLGIPLPIILIYLLIAGC